MTESLDRFVNAQASDYEQAVHELEQGSKEGHWMWFVFPQLRGLGISERATYFGLRDVNEAREYLKHPILGPRLARATRAVLSSNESVEQVLGELDALKFVSCMTLFSAASANDGLYAQTLDRLNKVDLRTLEILKEQEPQYD